MEAIRSHGLDQKKKVSWIIMYNITFVCLQKNVLGK